MPDELAIPELPQELVALREGWIPTWILFTNALVAQSLSGESRNLTAAYYAAFGEEYAGPSEARHNAAKLMSRPEIAAFLTAFFEWLTKQDWRGLCLSYVEKRMVLAQAVRVNINDVIDMDSGRVRPEYGHLVEKAELTRSFDKQGNPVEKLKVELIGKLSAIQTDNKMEGHELAKPLDVNLNVTQQPRTEEEAQAEFLKCLESPLFREAILELPGVRERLAIPAGED